jgi:hypothetical protein
MTKGKFPKRIAVTFDGGDTSLESLLAWSSLDTAEEGRVAVYELVEEFDKKMVSRVRRKGTKNWFDTE